jgi:hypothetical protein
MNAALKITKLSCEQVYNLWATEPYLIRLIDLRPDTEFKVSHIPGSENVHPDQIIDALDSLGDRLAVIIAPEKIETALANSIGHRQNFVFMSHCHRWVELNKPLAGPLFQERCRMRIFKNSKWARVGNTWNHVKNTQKS